jgi:hypothetical protein
VVLALDAGRARARLAEILQQVRQRTLHHGSTA